MYTDGGFLPATRNADGSSRMLPLLQVGMVPGDYVVIATVDLENTSTIGGLVKCQLANLSGILYARERQPVTPLIGVESGGGSMTLTAAGFFPTGTTLNVQCATYADGPTLPVIRGETRLILMPAQV
jgi:hypothetical protein